MAPTLFGTSAANKRQSYGTLAVEMHQVRWSHPGRALQRTRNGSITGVESVGLSHLDGCISVAMLNLDSFVVGGSSREGPGTLWSLFLVSKTRGGADLN